MNVSIDPHTLSGVVIGLSELVAENDGGAAELYVGRLENGHLVKIVVLDEQTAKEDGYQDGEHELIVTDAS